MPTLNLHSSKIDLFRINIFIGLLSDYRVYIVSLELLYIQLFIFDDAHSALLSLSQVWAPISTECTLFLGAFMNT